MLQEIEKGMLEQYNFQWKENIFVGDKVFLEITPNSEHFWQTQKDKLTAILRNNFSYFYMKNGKFYFVKNKE